MLLDSTGRKNHAPAAVDAFDANSGVQLNAVLHVPLERVQKDVLRFARSGENTRKQYPVVVPVRFFPENNNVEVFSTLARDKFFDKTRAGHSIADDNQLLFCCHEATTLSVLCRDPTEMWLSFAAQKRYKPSR